MTVRYPTRSLPFCIDPAVSARSTPGYRLTKVAAGPHRPPPATSWSTTTGRGEASPRSGELGRRAGMPVRHIGELAPASGGSLYQALRTLASGAREAVPGAGEACTDGRGDCTERKDGRTSRWGSLYGRRQMPRRPLEMFRPLEISLRVLEIYLQRLEIDLRVPEIDFPGAGDTSPIDQDLSPGLGDLSWTAGDLSPGAGDLSPGLGDESRGAETSPEAAEGSPGGALPPAKAGGGIAGAAG